MKQLKEEVFYTAPKIFTGDDWLADHVIVCNKDEIIDILPRSALSESAGIISYDDCILAPSFIDLQIYGAYGKLLAVFPEADSLVKLVEYCMKGGAAFCLPTLATNTVEVFKKSIDVVRDYWDTGGEGVLGLHLEGPWINPIRRGAHEASIIHAPSLPEVKELLDYGDGVVKMITLAPEVCTQEVIDYILSKNIIISAGHSNATDKEATDGFNRGVTAVTHLFNAMSPLLHRAPGLPGATFSNDKVFASIIADGYHVDYSIIRIAKTLMKERLFLITDAVTETDSGYYKHKATGDKYEADGILSGSGLDMAKAVRNMINFAGIEIDEALRMASTYPASVMKLDKLGKIKKENTARMVVLDSNLEVKQVL